MAEDSGAQNWGYGVRCWKVWAQGFGSGWAGIMRYGAQFWTPLIVYSILKGRSTSQGASAEELRNAGLGVWIIPLRYMRAKQVTHEM